MLTSDLLVTRSRGDTISPVFVTPEGDHLELARDVILVFKDYTGRRLGELNGILEELEDQGFDYRLVRGLVSLLERRCDLSVESAIDPQEARRAVFEAAAERYPVLTPEARKLVISQASFALGLSENDLEQSLYADLEDHLVISSFQEPEASELLAYYNLGLAQALLFKATQLRFRMKSGHKEVLRKLKQLGLMYDAVYDGDRVDITVEGPVSALKMSERYGTSFAKLLPYIVGSSGWKTDATILRKDYSGAPRLYRFEMAQETHSHLFRKPFEAAQEFDSSIEEAFHKSFGNAGTGWAISREPEPLITGKYLFIPDFLLEKDGLKVYVEIAGFWTAEYLRRKAAKLREIKDQNLIVIANDKMSCEAFREVPDVIFYDKKIPMKPVLERLKKLENKASESVAASIARKGLKLEDDVIRLPELAAKEGVSISSVRFFLESSPPGGYLLTTEELISERLLDELRTTLPANMPYAAATDKIKGKGVTAVDAVLQALGYTVRWTGLDPESARISKSHTGKNE